jgi:hypothetical protein
MLWALKHASGIQYNEMVSSVTDIYSAICLAHCRSLSFFIISTCCLYRQSAIIVIIHSIDPLGHALVPVLKPVALAF